MQEHTLHSWIEGRCSVAYTSPKTGGKRLSVLETESRTAFGHRALHEG